MSSKAWHYIGSSSSDGTPGLTQNWETYLARSVDGRFHIKLSGDEEQTESFGDVDSLVTFISDLGTPTPGTFLCALVGRRGFKRVVDKLEKVERERVRALEKVERERVRAEMQREIDALEYVLEITRPARNSADYVSWWNKIDPLWERLEDLKGRIRRW